MINITCRSTAKTQINTEIPWLSEKKNYSPHFEYNRKPLGFCFNKRCSGKNRIHKINEVYKIYHVKCASYFRSGFVTNKNLVSCTYCDHALVWTNKYNIVEKDASHQSPNKTDK